MEIEILIKIAKEIRETVKEYIAEHEDYGEMVNLRPHDITRKIDLVAEDALEKALISEDISARVISEELGDRIIGKKPGSLLVFDPIDGSTNATCGIPYFCTSLAYTQKIEQATFRDITMGVICSILGDTYHAIKNRGAFLNNKPLKNKRGVRPKPVVGIYSYGVPYVPRGIIEFQKTVIARALGSIALDLCYVADGTLDGVVDTRGLISGYDILAATLILREMGGDLTDLQGKPIDEDVKASNLAIIGTKNRKLHKRIVETLRR